MNCCSRTNLILVELTVLVFLFSFVLKCYDDKSDEDVNHEEGYNNDVYEEEDSDAWPVVVNGSSVFVMRVYAAVH